MNRAAIVLRTMAEGALLAFFCALLWASIWIADALMTPVPAQVRCFAAADHTQNYCREQRDWGES